MCLAAPFNLSLEERVDQKVAHWLTTLTVKDLRKYNPSSPTHHCKTDKDFEAALTKLKKFLASIVGKLEVQRTYRFAHGKAFGRLFSPKSLQNVWRAFRGALCVGMMTDIDMKNCHPVILLWICDKFGIDCPVLRKYVEDREFHLTELGKAMGGKDREACKRLFLVATNTNKQLKNIPYAFFADYQAEIQGTIQPALMAIEELACFRSHAEEAARRKEAGGGEANEEGSFLNLVLCNSENDLLMEVKAFLDSVDIQAAVLAFDGIMVYGDHYGHDDLLEQLHDRLKAKFDIEMHFDFKAHDTTALDDMPPNFDPTVVLGGEWIKRHTKKDGTTWSSGVLFNISVDHLLDETSRGRILSACHGQGAVEGRPTTWDFAARKLWTRAGLDEAAFAQAWAATTSFGSHHDGSTLRHYSRESDRSKHNKICEEALGLGGRTTFKEVELRDYYLKVVGDDVLCLNQRASFYVWHKGRWSEDSGPIMAHQLMDLVHELFQGCLSHYEKKLSKLVIDGEGDGEAAKKQRDQIKAIASTANQYGNMKNQNVLNLIKNHLRANSRHDDPFDNQPYVFCFTNVAYDLERQRGREGWFCPDKYDYLLMSCQKPWREPTGAELATVASWFASVFPDLATRKAFISILKSGLSGERFEYFFVATGGGRNGKGLLIEHFIHLLDMNGYAVIGHLDLLTLPIKSGANSEARSLHKKRFVRFSEPNPESGEAIRLSNVNELTGNEQLKARTGHDFSARGDDTCLHGTNLIECNGPPPCKGDKGDSAQERWRWIDFAVKFTDDPVELASDPIRYRPKDPTLKWPEAKLQHYCAFFKYLITADGVWNPGKSLDDYIPEASRQMAKSYLAENDELSSWFLDQYEQEREVDADGLVINFVPLKEVVALYKEHDIYKFMKHEDKRRFNAQRVKKDLEKNIVLKPYFRTAKKIKLATTGTHNTQEGLIHYKRKRAEEDGEPSSQGACLNAQFGADW